MSQSTALSMLVIGLLWYLYSLFYYIREISTAPYSDMGVEMSFSAYWLGAGIFTFAGAAVVFQLNLLFVIVGLIFAYLAGFPLCTVLRALFMGTRYTPPEKKEEKRGGLGAIEQKAQEIAEQKQQDNKPE